MPRLKFEFAPLEERGGIRSFNQAEQLLYLADGRWRARRKIHRNTELSRVNNGIALLLHKMPIIIWNKDNLAKLDSNSYYTLTTRQRISEWLPDPLEIYERSGYWWVKLLPEDRPFHDGMVIDIETLTEFGPVFDIDAVVKHNIEWEGRISSYMTKWKDGTLDNSSNFPLGAGLKILENVILNSQTFTTIAAKNGTWRTLQDDYLRSYLRHHLLKGAYTGRKVTPGWDYSLPWQNR